MNYELLWTTLKQSLKEEIAGRTRCAGHYDSIMLLFYSKLIALMNEAEDKERTAEVSK